MPIYYFHLIEDGRRSPDRDGSPFASFELAYLATHRAVQDMWWEMVKRGKDPRTCSFEITDASGRSLAIVPFTEPLDDAAQSGGTLDELEAGGGTVLQGVAMESPNLPVTEAISLDRPSYSKFL